jgi:predicted nucleic acid-binding protein
MEISRKIILDLLPLYIAGEVSDDSRKLIEDYLDHDEELRRLAERIEKSDLKEIPMTEQTELSLEAYRKANKWMVLRTLGLALIISLTVMGLLAFGVLVANLDVFF